MYITGHLSGCNTGSELSNHLDKGNPWIPLNLASAAIGGRIFVNTLGAVESPPQPWISNIFSGTPQWEHVNRHLLKSMVNSQSFGCTAFLTVLRVSIWKDSCLSCWFSRRKLRTTKTLKRTRFPLVLVRPALWCLSLTRIPPRLTELGKRSCFEVSSRGPLGKEGQSLTEENDCVEWHPGPTGPE